MKLCIALGLVLAATIVGHCHGYTFLIPAKINRPGVCMYHGLLLKRGDNSIASSCQNMHCNDDGSILVQGCGHYDMRDCRIVDALNLDKPYPDCCKLNFLCSALNGQPVNRVISPLDQRIYA